MEDAAIVELYWQRAPEAIGHTQEKYGAYCLAIAGRLVPVREDAEECVNDTYLSLWQGIPPAKPDPLLPYALRVTRNLCLKRKRWNTAGKRSSPFDAAFEELEDCLGDSAGPEASFDEGELKAALNSFVRGLSHRDRVLFLGRYWYGCSLKELGERLSITENNGAVRLSRLREKLRKYLLEKGVLE